MRLHPSQWRVELVVVPQRVGYLLHLFIVNLSLHRRLPIRRQRALKPSVLPRRSSRRLPSARLVRRPLREHIFRQPQRLAHVWNIIPIHVRAR